MFIASLNPKIPGMVTSRDGTADRTATLSSAAPLESVVLSGNFTELSAKSADLSKPARLPNVKPEPDQSSLKEKTPANSSLAALSAGALADASLPSSLASVADSDGWVIAGERACHSLTPIAVDELRGASDSAAIASLKALATEDSELGAIDGGNRGLSAYSLSTSGALNLLAVAKDIYPGAEELKSYRHNPATTDLVAALTSEDEPRIHLFPQSKGSGELGATIIDLNAEDLIEADAELYQAAFPGASPDDPWEAMTAFFSRERHLDLGPGSAKHLWWT